jgi:hypothetical protein
LRPENHFSVFVCTENFHVNPPPLPTPSPKKKTEKTNYTRAYELTKEGGKSGVGMVDLKLLAVALAWVGLVGSEDLDPANS